MDETQFGELKGELGEIKGDVKALVAAIADPKRGLAMAHERLDLHDATIAKAKTAAVAGGAVFVAGHPWTWKFMQAMRDFFGG